MAADAIKGVVGRRKKDTAETQQSPFIFVPRGVVFGGRFRMQLGGRGPQETSIQM
ncbi:hypothetical protein ACLOJK_034927, partial [Asimina triloba]